MKLVSLICSLVGHNAVAGRETMKQVGKGIRVRYKDVVCLRCGAKLIAKPKVVK